MHYFFQFQRKLFTFNSKSRFLKSAPCSFKNNGSGSISSLNNSCHHSTKDFHPGDLERLQRSRISIGTGTIHTRSFHFKTNFISSFRA